MRCGRNAAALCAAVLLGLAAPINAGDVVTIALDALGGETDYKLTPTACDVRDCVRGGCLFTRCVTPVSCSGGLCTFTRCKTAVCEGGLCTFDSTETASCPGGGCRFNNIATTLLDGYCDGGACTLDGVPHPRQLSHVLSE